MQGFWTLHGFALVSGGKLLDNYGVVFCVFVLHGFLGLLRLEAFLGAGGPALLWKWVCWFAWMQTAAEWLYESIDSGTSSLNLAAVLRNLKVVWTELPGWGRGLCMGFVKILMDFC